MSFLSSVVHQITSRFFIQGIKQESVNCWLNSDSIADIELLTVELRFKCHHSKCCKLKTNIIITILAYSNCYHKLVILDVAAVLDSPLGLCY